MKFTSDTLWTVVNIINFVPLAFRRDDTGFAEESSRLDTIEEQSLVSEVCHLSSIFILEHCTFYWPFNKPFCVCV